MEPRLRLLLSVVLVTAMAAVFAVTFALPNPTPFQSLALRLLFAMIAGLVVFVSYIQLSNVETFKLPLSLRAPIASLGTVAVFVLFYFVNPVDLITRGQRSEPLAFLEAADQSLTQQDSGTAELLYSRALESYQESRDLAGVARSHLGLSNVASSRGDYAKAQLLAEAALTEFATINNLSGIADAHFQLGLLYDRLNDRKRAHEFLSKALAGYKRLGAVGKVELVERRLEKVTQAREKE